MSQASLRYWSEIFDDLPTARLQLYSMYRPHPVSVALSLILLLRINRVWLCDLASPTLRTLWLCHYSWLDDHLRVFALYPFASEDELWAIEVTLRGDASFWTDVVSLIPSLWGAWEGWRAGRILPRHAPHVVLAVCTRILWPAQYAVEPSAARENLQRLWEAGDSAASSEARTR